MTDAERIEIIRARTAEGWSCAKIAPEAECSGAKVNHIQREKGFVKPKGEEKDRPPRTALLAYNGVKSREMCKHLGRGLLVVQRWLDYYDIKRVHNGPHIGLMIDLREMKTLAAEGLCAAYIAERMELAPATVMKVAREEGIELARGDAQAGRRKRPTLAEFSKVYKQYTLGVLSSIYGVTTGTVSKWALLYNLRAQAPKRRPRLMNKSVCTRPIAGSCSPRAVERALAKAGRA